MFWSFILIMLFWWKLHATSQMTSSASKPFYDITCAFQTQFQKSKQERTKCFSSAIEKQASNQSNTQRRKEAFALKLRQNNMQQKFKTKAQMQGYKKLRHFSASASEFTQIQIELSEWQTFIPQWIWFLWDWCCSISIFESQVIPVIVYNLSKRFCPNLAPIRVLSLGKNIISRWSTQNKRKNSGILSKIKSYKSKVIVSLRLLC